MICFVANRTNKEQDIKKVVNEQDIKKVVVFSVFLTRSVEERVIDGLFLLTLGCNINKSRRDQDQSWLRKERCVGDTLTELEPTVVVGDEPRRDTPPLDRIACAVGML